MVEYGWGDEVAGVELDDDFHVVLFIIIQGLNNLILIFPSLIITKVIP